MSYVVLIPAYKPDEKLLALLDSFGGVVEHVVVVDDGSGNEYKSLFDSVRATGAVVLTHDVNRGKGAAIKTGIRYARENLPGYSCVTADADGQHTFKDISAIARLMEERKGALVLGVRNIKEMPARSRFGNSITLFFFRLATGLKITDTQTGLRGYPTAFLEQLEGISGDRYEYEMNMLLELKKLGIPYRECPIDTVYIENNASSHFHPVRDGLRVFSRVLFYCASALACTAIDFAVYSLLCWLSLSVSLAYIIARVISSALNYQLNRTVVFRTKPSVFNFVGYFVLVLFIMAVGSMSTHYIAVLGVNEVLAKLMVDTVLFVFNFFVQKHVIFKQPNKK